MGLQLRPVQNVIPATHTAEEKYKYALVREEKSHTGGRTLYYIVAKFSDLGVAQASHENLNQQVLKLMEIVE